MVAVGWFVLALVFLDELLAVAAVGVWGWSASPRIVLVWLLPLVTVLAWFLLASPKAPLGGPVIRPVTKVVVFGLATLALWDAGHPTLAIAFLTFSVVVNGLALVPSIRDLADPHHTRTLS